MQVSFSPTLRPIIGNINKLFPLKTEMWKKQVLQDPWYVGGVKGTYCMLYTMLQEIPHFEGVKRNKDKLNRSKMFISNVKGVKRNKKYSNKYI